MCECNAIDFSARSAGSGNGRSLVVEGSCTCPRAGHVLELQPDNPGINPDPSEVVLRLAITAPDVGATVVTRTPVRYETTIGPEAERVLIRVRDQATLEIQIVEEGDEDGYRPSGS
jgi:hypothetical protein